jgi:5-methylcytosine-specific restriction endonuclease McrA
MGTMAYGGSPEQYAANLERRREKYAANRERFNELERKRRANPYVRERRKKQGREWREDNREYLEQRRREYEADPANRERRKELDRQRRADPEYRARRAQQNRDNRAANREQRKQYNREWTAANRERYRELINQGGRKRRALIADAQIIPFTIEQWAAKVAYWGGRCWVCGGEWSDADHVKPIAAGGSHVLCNFRPICRSCNSSKKDRWPLADVLGVHQRPPSVAA